MKLEEMLERLKPKITWKICLKDTAKTVYRQIEKTYFETVTKEACRMEVRDFYELAASATIAGLTDALLEDSKRLFSDDLFLESRKHGIGFVNGIFDLRSGKMRKYQTSDFVCDALPHKLPWHLNRDIDAWFVNILKQWVGEETGEWFMNLLAYLLFLYPNGENIWVNFFGSGANGKSVCLELLERILGEKKCIGCDLKNINRFSGDTFKDKWLVLGRDSSPVVSDNATSFIKTFSGDPKFLVERKGGASFDTMNQGKLIVSTNSLIQSKDRSYAWYRRLFPILFPNKFDRNEPFKYELFQRTPEIIRCLLHRAYQYRHTETSLFKSIPEPVIELMRETRMLNDRVAAFWEHYFFKEIETPTLQTVLDWDKLRSLHGLTMSQVYAQYCWWHEQEFGDIQVEPGLRTFGGPYGAFLQSEAQKYFSYHKTRAGRVVELKENFREAFK